MEVLRSEEADEVMVITRWEDKNAFDSWVRSDEFKAAHGRGAARGCCEGTLRWAPTKSPWCVSRGYRRADRMEAQRGPDVLED